MDLVSNFDPRFAKKMWTPDGCWLSKFAAYNSKHDLIRDFCLQENFKFEIEQYVAAEWVNSAGFVYISIRRIQGVASLVTNTM